jgi:exosortase
MTALATYRNVAIVTAIVIFAFYPTLTELMERWLKFDESQSHGLIIIALFAHLFTRELKQLPSTSMSPNWLGTIALAASSVAWCLSATLNIEAIEQFLLLPITFFLCWSLLGFRSTVALTPSISLLIFAVPIWDYLTPTLVDASSHVVMTFIELSNITALIDGNSIYLPYGRIDIADGCSGLRYFTIAIALAYYLILTSETTLATKVKLLGTAIGLGLFTNWLRIYIIIMVAHLTEMQSSLVKDHELFGWLLFFIVCLPLVYFARTLPIRSEATKTATTSPLAKQTIFVSIIALISGPLLYTLMNTNVSTPAIGNWQQLGYQQMTTPSAGPFQLPQSNLNLRKESDGIIQNTPQKIVQEIAIHWQQNKESDLVPYIASSLNRDHWVHLQASTMQTPDKHSLQLNLYSKKAIPNQFSCTASWYRVGGMETSNYYAAKLLQIPALLIQKKQFSAAVITINSDSASCEQHRQQLIEAATETRADIVQLTQPAE